MRYLAPLLLVFLASAPAAQPGAGATLTGRVKLPKGQEIQPKRVWVYLKDVQRRRSNPPPGEGRREQIKQNKRRFEPQVLIVPVGTTVWFPNYDHEEHNVFSPTEPGFDLGRYKNDKKGKPHKFDDVDDFAIYCDIHQEMEAWVKVVDTTHITEVASDGTYTLTDVPPGTYKVVVWMPNAKDVSSSEITVTDGGTMTVTEELHPQPKPNPRHKRIDGNDYDVYSNR